MLMKNMVLAWCCLTALSASAKTYQCKGAGGGRALDYTVELTEITGLTSESLWHMAVINNSDGEGKTYSGMADLYYYHGRYAYDKDSRYYEFKGEVLAINPKTGKVTFKPNIRLGMPVGCTEI